MFKKTLAALTICGAMASPAMASQISLNTGVDFFNDGSTQTSPTDQLGYTGTLATSIYLGNPATVGTSVIDTNIASVMNTYGFSAGNHATVGGPVLPFSYPVSPGQLNIDALNTPADANGFVSGSGGGFNSYGINDGFGNKTWGLTYQYQLNGVTTANAVQFNSGFLNVYYNDGGAAKQVLRLNVTGSDVQLTNLNLFGLVSFDFDGNGTDDAASDPFIQSLFIDVASGKSFYDLWKVDPTIASVSWTLDTNVDPPLPTIDQLWQTPTGALIRQTTLDGSIVFNVPEPTSVALLGLGLLGLGFTRKSKKSNG